MTINEKKINYVKEIGTKKKKAEVKWWIENYRISKQKRESKSESESNTNCCDNESERNEIFSRKQD